MRLTPEEGRVIGSLVEKQLTTPQQYPLTLNSLVLACNQSSNREPVVAYDEPVVQAALAALRSAEMVSLVYPSHGRSVTRYRHTLTERLGLDERELALVAVLLLRGPQTVGEFRARTERMAQFDGIGAVDADLVRLSEKPEPLVVRLPRRPGQKEERWVQLLERAGGGIAGALDGPARPRRSTRPTRPPSPTPPAAPLAPRLPSSPRSRPRLTRGGSRRHPLHSPAAMESPIEWNPSPRRSPPSAPKWPPSPTPSNGCATTWGARAGRGIAAEPGSPAWWNDLTDRSRSRFPGAYARAHNPDLRRPRRRFPPHTEPLCWRPP